MSGQSITVLSLGGTVAMAADERGGGVVPALGAEELIAAVPELEAAARIETRNFRQLPGAHLSLGDLTAAAAEITACINGGADGVVVTQGTDTIEETAFVLDLLIRQEAPVVVTGALRHPGLAGADGPANLLAAVQVAASVQARGLGAVVVMNDEIHAARFVRKTHTMNPGAFTSPALGPVGWIAEGVPVVATRPAGALPPIDSLSDKGEIPAVALLTMALGDDGRMCETLAGAGYAGCVIEALGGGHVPEAVAARLEGLARSMPVVLASRTGSGEVLKDTYGFPGSERDLRAKGLIRAGWLTGVKARLLLALVLGAGAERDDITRAFGCFGGG